MGPALPLKHVAQHLLGRGLARRPGDRDHLCIRARPRRGPKPLQRRQHIVHDKKRRICADTLGHVTDQRCRRTLFQRGTNKLMPVAHIFQRDKQIARLKGARVNRHTMCPPVRPLRTRARRPNGVVARPERAHTPRPSSAATATLACSTSSKGITLSPMVWPDSCPLPAIRSVSPGPSASTARKIASARSPTS